MIFDLVYIRDFKNEILHEFDYNIYNQTDKLKAYSNVVSNRLSLRTSYIFLDTLGRGNLDKSRFDSDEFLLVVIGECYSRFDSSVFGYEAKLLTAEELGRLYAQKNENFLKEIKGNFQLIISHKKEECTTLFNSRGGVSPLYYYFEDNLLLIATATYLIPDKIKKKIKISSRNILEFIIFNYPLAESTLFKNVYNLLPGEMITFKQNGEPIKKTYFNIFDLFYSKGKNYNEALEEGLNIFPKIVNSYLNDKKKYCMSLTGGFDGRANLSVTKLKKEYLMLYAFGIKGSKDITIPSNISDELGLSFEPYYLEDKFINLYPEYSSNYILLTDCLTPVKSSNHLYVFEKLSKFSDVVITGIFGSELLKTFQNPSGMVSDCMFEICGSKNKINTLIEIIKRYDLKDVWGDRVFNKSIIESMLESFNAKYLQKTYKNSNEFLLNYTLKDGFRKYFGAEVHSERIFANNRFPFYDDEFVEFVFKAPFSPINNKIRNPGISKKLNSHKFYAELMKKFRPELLDYNTDRGYSPKFLLNRFPAIYIVPQYLLNRFLTKDSQNREFRSSEWTEKQIEAYSHILEVESILNVSKIKELYASNTWKKVSLNESRKLFSLQYYLTN